MAGKDRCFDMSKVTGDLAKVMGDLAKAKASMLKERNGRGLQFQMG